MDTFTPSIEVSLAPLVLLVAAIGAGLALMQGRRTLAIVLGLVALTALIGAVLWTVLP